MDEELIELKIEDSIDVDIEIVEEDVTTTDLEQDVNIAETVEDIDVSTEEEIEIEVEEFVGWTGGDNTKHYSLAGRDEPNQHPIKAITGLREELDDITKLKTLYSDKINIANYYEWADASYDEYGYFVSLVPNTSTIKICDGSDILGVSVEVAGFIGGQSVVAPKDNSYGLIVTSGLVDVRCELDVEVGNYIVSNERGYAKKSDSDYGYKVLALETKGGIRYAVIMLGVQADITDKLAQELNAIDSRLDSAELNIVAAINVANQAYNKANEIDVSNKIMSDKVAGALGVVDKVTSDVENLESQVSNSTLISTQAKAIAESAATSAESMKNEAVEKANEALADTSKLRKELEVTVAEINEELDNTVLELEATKEGFNETINDLKLDTEGQLADFKKEVEDNYATTTQLAAVKTENSDAVAALKQEVSDTYATTESVTSLKTETSEALTGFKQEVSETYATQEMLTSLETETSKALTDYKQEVTDTYATQEMVTTLETNTSKALADYKQEVEDEYATQEMVTKLETDTSKALTDYKQEVGDTYATQTSLTTLRTDTANAIAASEEKATNTYASKSDLTSFESDTNIAMARIEQKADANGAYIQSTVSNMDKYSVGPHSQAYGFTLEQAASILEIGMIYVPTQSVTEKYLYDNNTKTYERTFTPQYLYKWGTVNNQYRWITVDKNYTETDEANTSAKAVYFTTTEPSVSGNFGYWYTNGDTVTEPYKSYTLYKWESYVDENQTTQYHWVAVATLAGNSSNRAVSQIRQDANSIEASVTTIDEKYAGTKTWVDENKSAIQATVTWKNDNAESITTFMQEASDNFASASQVAKIVDKDGNINAASIVTAVNDAGSSVVIDADHIDLNGYVTMTDLSNKGSKTFINGGNIITDTISADVINVTDLKAFGATIGGFTINDTSIYHTKTSYNDETNNGVYIGTNGIGLGKGKFYVTDEGYLHAESGEFSGDITGASGTFSGSLSGATISGGTISGSELTGGSININDNFIVDSDGNVSLNGSIVWGTGSSPTQAVYGRSNYTKPANNTSWSSFPSTSTTGWHRTYSSTYDYCASYTYDGGISWSDAILIRGTDGNNGATPYVGDNGNWYVDDTDLGIRAKGQDGQDGKDGEDGLTPYIEDGWWCLDGVNLGVKAEGTDAEVTPENVFNVLTNGGTKFGCFYSDNDELYINAEYIQAGVIESHASASAWTKIDLDNGTIDCANNSNRLELDAYGLAFSGSVFVPGASFVENSNISFSSPAIFGYNVKMNSTIEMNGDVVIQFNNIKYKIMRDANGFLKATTAAS